MLPVAWPSRPLPTLRTVKNPPALAVTPRTITICRITAVLAIPIPSDTRSNRHGSIPSVDSG